MHVAAGPGGTVVHTQPRSPLRDKELDMSAIDRSAQPLAALRPPTGPELPETKTAPRVLAGSAAASGRPRLRGWWRVITPVLLLVVWQLTHVFNLISPQKLPPPTTVVSTGWSLIAHPTPAFGSLQGALLVSCERFAIGFGVGASIAIALAMVAGLSRVGEAAVDPIVQMIRTLPLFGLINVFIIWFGIGTMPKVTLVALGASVPLYLNTYSGIRSIDGRLYELAHVLGLNRRELLLNVVLPGALPQALVGLRQSLGAAWLSLVVAEQINAHQGLGFMISQAATFLRNDVVFVALIVYTMLGLLTDWIVRIFERRALAWRTDLVM
jgi:sulfonate transport system permease protein